MLGLAEQIECDPIGVIIPVRDHKNFRRPRDHIDANLAEHPPFRGGNVGVAGAGDRVDGRDRVGAIGQCGHCLRPADAVNLIDARQPRSQQHQRVQNPIRRGHNHRKPFDARNLGRDRIHQNRGRIARQTARHIKPCGRNRAPPPAERCTRVVLPFGILWQLARVVGADTRGGKLKRGTVLGRYFGHGRVNFGYRDAQGLGRQGDTVEFLGQCDHSRITRRANLRDNVGDRVVHIGAVFAFGRQQRCKRLFKIGLIKV